MPSILEYIGYDKTFISFGKSMFSNQSWAITKRKEDTYLITENGINIHKNNKHFCFEDWQLKEKKPTKKEDVQLLNAIRQSYNKRMIHNQLTVK